MSQQPSKKQTPAESDHPAYPLPSQPRATPPKPADPYDELAVKVARGEAVSGFDFGAPQFLKDAIPCPVFPGDDVRDEPRRQDDTTRCRLTSEIDLWLAEQGYKRESKPGYLGLVLNAGTMAVSREGCPSPVRLGPHHFRLFCTIFRAKSEGIAPDTVRKAFGGTAAALRNAVNELRDRLGPLGITVDGRQWRLIEKK